MAPKLRTGRDLMQAWSVAADPMRSLITTNLMIDRPDNAEMQGHTASKHAMNAGNKR